MERLQSLTVAAVLAAAAPGCIHVHTDPAGKVKAVDVSATADPGVKQASATVPAAAVPAAAGGLTKLATKLPTFGGPSPASSLFVTWQNRVAQLPDPTADGKFKPGLVGQMFLFGGGPKMAFVPPDGKVTIELFDATRPGAEPTRLGSWTFEKDVLTQLITTDERFGKCYALFLPWPSYSPAVGRVKLLARYEPQHGHTLHAEPMFITLDTTVGPEGPQITRTNSTVIPGAAAPVLLSPVPVGGAPAAASPAIPIQPSGPGSPSGLPPLTITMPGR